MWLFSFPSIEKIGNNLCLINLETKNTPLWLPICSKVHIFWEGHKILRNLHRRFDRYYIGQIYSGDFAKICGLFRIYELYKNRDSSLQDLYCMWNDFGLKLMECFISVFQWNWLLHSSDKDNRHAFVDRQAIKLIKNYFCDSFTVIWRVT